MVTVPSGGLSLEVSQRGSLALEGGVVVVLAMLERLGVQALVMWVRR